MRARLPSCPIAQFPNCPVAQLPSARRARDVPAGYNPRKEDLTASLAHNSWGPEECTTLPLLITCT